MKKFYCSESVPKSRLVNVNHWVRGRVQSRRRKPRRTRSKYLDSAKILANDSTSFMVGLPDPADDSGIGKYRLRGL